MRSRHKWEGNFETGLNEIGCISIDYIYLTKKGAVGKVL
jgi:hypothetical protein